MKLLYLLSLTIIIACQSKINEAQNLDGKVTEVVVENPKPNPKETSTINQYSWISNYNIANALVNRIPCPKGFERIKERKGSFADWLRYLPIQKSGAEVLLHNGQLKYRQDVHAAVIDIDIGKRDLQQCADAVMRLKAEYHYSLQEFEDIHFNFTSGDKVSFEDWRRGQKPSIQGNRVVFSAANGQLNNSYSNFQKYLIQIFSYAGTASLEKELKPIEVSNMKIGDVFIQGGFPGHAVIVVDMAEDASGNRLFLLAQSYMPAQSIHILKNFEEEGDSPWYSLDFGSQLNTAEWTFDKDDLMRF